MVAAAARELADRTGRTVRVRVLAGGRRAAGAETTADRRHRACSTRRRVAMHGVVAGPVDTYDSPIDWPYRVDEAGHVGAAVGSRARRPRRTSARSGSPNGSVLLEGALTEAGVDRAELAA